jgi:hypothetical protein
MPYPSIHVASVRVNGVTYALGGETLGSHRLRIRKGSTTYGVPLVTTSDPLASPLRIYDSGAVKAFPKKGNFDGFTPSTSWSPSDGCGNYSAEGSGSNTYDENTSSYYGFYFNNPHPEHWHQLTFTYTYTFSSAKTLLNLLYRIYSYGGGRACSENWWYLEYYNGSWNTVNSWSGAFGWSENGGEGVYRTGQDTGEVVANINASNVTQIRFRAYANIYEWTGIRQSIYTLRPFTV